MKICVIDIGTNSIHAIFAKTQGIASFHILDKEKEMVRLGDKAMVSGKLSTPTMQASLNVLKRFNYLIKHRNIAAVVAVATSAVREASNGGEFIDKIKKQIGLKVRVITGQEEARLIYLAVKHNHNFTDKTGLVVDIGGGSTEFILANRQKAFWMESLKMGANRLNQLYPLSDPPKKEELKKLEKNVLKQLAPIIKSLRKKKAHYIIGTSGTLMNLFNLIK